MNLALIFLVLVIAIGLCLDIFLVIKKGTDATISWQIYSFSQRYPIIAFLAGLLMGHFFWVQYPGV